MSKRLKASRISCEGGSEGAGGIEMQSKRERARGGGARHAEDLVVVVGSEVGGSLAAIGSIRGVSVFVFSAGLFSFLITIAILDSSRRHFRSTDGHTDTGDSGSLTAQKKKETYALLRARYEVLGDRHRRIRDAG